MTNIDDIILQELQKLRGDVGEIKQDMVRNEEQHIQIQNALLSINKSLYGNGTPGIKEEISCLDVAVQDLDGRLGELEQIRDDREKEVKEDRKENKKANRALIYTAITLAVTTVLSWALNLFLH